MALAIATGCSESLPSAGPPHLRLQNYDDTNHHVSVSIQRDTESDSVILERAFDLQAQGSRDVDDVFQEPGEYRATVNVDDRDPVQFTWTIEEIPVGGGFRLVIEKDGSIHDDVVGSP